MHILAPLLFGAVFLSHLPAANASNGDTNIGDEESTDSSSPNITMLNFALLNDMLDSEIPPHNSSNSSDLFDDELLLKSIQIAEAVANESLLDNASLALNDSQGFMSFEQWKKLKQQHPNTTNDTASLCPPKPSPKTKKLQNRINFALADCGASVVATLGKGAGAILKENKDLYLLNECRVDKKFVVIELCQEIYVESVVIGNYEFFSSQFKEVRILVLDEYSPSGKWWQLGDFAAENIRNVQLFEVTNPQIWARYLKLEVLSHYGNEYYCPISLVRVFGKTMMDDAKEDNDIIELVEPEIATPVLDKCIVKPPYLGLSQFLQDINLANTTEDAWCETEPLSTSLLGQLESVFKSILKRLSLLESNATLSLLYIEEQLKMLLEAFENLEKRQTLNFEVLVNLFNDTVTTLLLNFRANYAHLHQEYQKLLALQQQAHDDTMRDSKGKIQVVTGEVLFQQRISLFNLVIIICMLIYVVITRQAAVDDIKESRVVRPAREFPVKRPGKRTRRKVFYVH